MERDEEKSRKGINMVLTTNDDEKEGGGAASHVTRGKTVRMEDRTRVVRGSIS
jgi:hypothetical protein